MQRFADFSLDRELGRGGSAAVYLARRDGSSEPICLKLFHPRVFQDEQTRKRIFREFRVLASLVHPNIVAVREILTETEPPALVMDYVDGVDLEKFQTRLPYILPEVSVLIVIEILKAIEYAHARDIVHRDLKPENILIRKDGHVFVTDFGLAKVQSASTIITRPHHIVGTADYMAPEQIGGDSVSPATDVFALGSILYFLVTGTRPFARHSPIETLSAIKNDPHEPPQARNPKVSTELSRILQKALAKNREDRYQGAGEFRGALTGYLAGVGLAGDFSLTEWASDPTSGTMDALRRASEALVVRADEAMKRKDRGAVLELIAHLSLKSPTSPSVSRLVKAMSHERRRVRNRRLAICSAGTLLIALLIFGFTRRPAATPPSMVAALQPVPQQAPAPTPAPVVKAAPAPRGEVRFNLGEGIRVLWDGKQIDPNFPLTNQTVGRHELTLIRAGFDPIRRRVDVRPGKPVVINAR